jgi:hypothetical protein
MEEGRWRCLSTSRSNTLDLIPKLHLPNEIFKLIFLLVASLVSTSFRMDMVDILSERKTASPFLKELQQKL